MLRGFLDWLAHGDRPDGPPPPPTRREQLIQAREQLQRQIEILQAGPVLARAAVPQTPQLIEDLTEALRDIEEELAGVEDGGSSSINDFADDTQPSTAPDHDQAR